MKKLLLLSILLISGLFFLPQESQAQSFMSRTLVLSDTLTNADTTAWLNIPLNIKELGQLSFQLTVDTISNGGADGTLDLEVQFRVDDNAGWLDVGESDIYTASLVQVDLTAPVNAVSYLKNFFYEDVRIRVVGAGTYSSGYDLSFSWVPGGTPYSP